MNNFPSAAVFPGSAKLYVWFEISWILCCALEPYTKLFWLTMMEFRVTRMKRHHTSASWFDDTFSDSRFAHTLSSTIIVAYDPRCCLCTIPSRSQSWFLVNTVFYFGTIQRRFWCTISSLTALWNDICRSLSHRTPTHRQEFVHRPHFVEYNVFDLPWWI